MNCVEIEQLMDAWLDGELSGSLKLEFDAHRLSCARCQNMLAMLEACQHVIADDTPPTPSFDFTDRVMAQAGAPRTLKLERARWKSRWVAMGLAQAAAVAAFAVLWSGGFRSAKPAPSVSAAGEVELTNAIHYIVGAGRGVADGRGLAFWGDVRQLAASAVTPEVVNEVDRFLSVSPVTHLLEALAPADSSIETPAAESDGAFSL